MSKMTIRRKRARRAVRERERHPICPACGQPGRLAYGSEVYPHRADLRAKPFWVCDADKTRVGCHPGTTVALGTMATPALRAACSRAHEAVDPIWLGQFDHNVSRHGQTISRQVARRRVYSFMAATLGVERDACHIGMFDEKMCRRVVETMRHISFEDVIAAGF